VRCAAGIDRPWGTATAAAPDVSGHMFFERRRHLTGIAEQAATRPVAEREGRAALAGEQIMHIGGAETPLLAQRARERKVQPGRKPRPEQLRAGQLCNALGVRSPLGDPLRRRTGPWGTMEREVSLSLRLGRQLAVRNARGAAAGRAFCPA